MAQAQCCTLLQPRRAAACRYCSCAIFCICMCRCMRCALTHAGMLPHCVQEGLQARGFTVERLNTYNTVPVESLPAADLAAAKAACVVAFASPSAVKAWLACAGGQDVADVAIACIGAGLCKQAPAVHARSNSSVCARRTETSGPLCVQGARQLRQRRGWA
jgi:hypothetical protein